MHYLPYMYFSAHGQLKSPKNILTKGAASAIIVQIITEF